MKISTSEIFNKFSDLYYFHGLRSSSEIKNVIKYRPNICFIDPDSFKHCVKF
jgi:hypothetical protein